MAYFSDIPGSLGMPAGVGVRRNSTNTGFEAFDTAPFSQSDVIRNLNEVFQPSNSDNVIINYSIDITATSTLLTPESSTVFLEISTDTEVGFIEMARYTHGISGIAATSTNTGHLMATINATWYARLRTTGNATVTYRSGQETSISIVI
jgi:hypothetical protein